jgi:hypothetical protein
MRKGLCPIHGQLLSVGCLGTWRQKIVLNLVEQIQGAPLAIFVALYVGASAVSILLILIKHLSANYRVRRLERKLGAGELKFRVPDFRPDRPATVRLVVVHGTWALRGDWHKRGSRFFVEMESCAMTRFVGRSIEVHRFLWSGGNTITDRARAMKRFHSFLTALTKTDSSGLTCPTFIVAHSHGGNVVLKVLDSDPELAKHIEGVITVATPFLVARKRQDAYGFLLALCNALLVGVASMLVYNELWRHSSDWTLNHLLGVGVIASVVFTICVLQKRSIERTVMASVQSVDLLRKFTVVRAAGDEAGAALGMGYILGYAVRVAAKIFGAVLVLPMRGIEYVIKGESDGKPDWVPEFIALSASVLGWWWLADAGQHYPAFSEEPLRAVGFGLTAWVGIAVLTLWVGYILQHVVGTIARSFVETLTAGVLLPFGPEMAFAAPFVTVSAEATPPRQGHSSECVPVLQLPYRHGELQHSFELHAVEIAEVVTAIISNRIANVRRSFFL